MTHAERFQICLDRAQEIVAAARAEAPEGCDPHGSYLAIAGVVIGAGTSVYSASQQSKAAKGASGAINSKSAGTVPKAAEYEEVHVGKEQLHTIFDNYKALDNIIPLDRRTNAFIDQDAMKRATQFIPGYKSAMDTYGRAGNDLLNARLPFSDVLDVVSNRTDLTNSVGIPGQGGTNATLKDLGLSQLDAVKAGGGILKDMVGIAETVNPVGRRATPQSMFLDPSERVNWQLQQNQFIQQSEQNKNNLAAAADPAAAMQMQLALAQAGQQAGGGGAGAGYAGAAQQLISGIGGAFGSRSGAGGASSAYQLGGAGPQPGTYYAKPVYYNGIVTPKSY